MATAPSAGSGGGLEANRSFATSTSTSTATTTSPFAGGTTREPAGKGAGSSSASSPPPPPLPVPAPTPSAAAPSSATSSSSSGRFKRMSSTVSAASIQRGSTRRRRLASLASSSAPSSSSSSSSSSSYGVKCVVVGDDAVGKTSMLMGYATHRYPTRHVPSVFNNYAGTVKVSGRTLHLEIIDTLEEDESPSVRHSEYPGTDVFVLCFSVVRPDSLRHVQDTWLPEIRAHAPPATSPPFILVGTQADLREVDEICAMLKERHEEPVSVAQGWAAARRLGAVCYVECSPGVEKKLRKIVNSAIASVLKATRHAKPSAKSKSASPLSSSSAAAAAAPPPPAAATCESSSSRVSAPESSRTRRSGGGWHRSAVGAGGPCAIL